MDNSLSTAASNLEQAAAMLRDASTPDDVSAAMDVTHGAASLMKDALRGGGEITPAAG